MPCIDINNKTTEHMLTFFADKSANRQRLLYCHKSSCCYCAPVPVRMNSFRTRHITTALICVYTTIGSSIRAEANIVCVAGELLQTHYYCYYNCYGVVSHKASHALRPFDELFCIPHMSSDHSWYIHQSSLAVTSRHLVAKRRKTLAINGR
jgi:hypothetical protein